MADPGGDPYAALEVSAEAPPDEIRRAYKRLARQWHPDKNPDPGAAERFRAIAAAWAILGDPDKRRAHDRRAGRVGASDGLEPEFVDRVASAIERAQDYVERVVVPHYASRMRGRGAAMAGELLRDLQKLGDPRWLQPRATRRGRRRAQLWLDAVHVTYGARAHDATELVMHPKGWVVRISPLALWNAGFRGAVDVDDAVLRLLVARYAQIVAAGRFRAPVDPGDEAWDAAIAAARRVDREEDARWYTWAAIWTGVGALILFMLFAGYTNL